MRHEIRFPQYAEDIGMQKRTLFHWPTDNIRVGDGLLLLAHPNFPRGHTAVITKVDHVKLCELTAEDLVMLNVPDAATYLARWDALNPDVSSSAGPMVYRIEFRYGPLPDGDKTPPEWALAG